MHGGETSDSATLATKPADNARRLAAEWVERRSGDRGEIGTAKHVPGTDPGKRVPGAGPRAANRKMRSRAKIRSRGRMPKLGPSGSVRGARGNSRPTAVKLHVAQCFQWAAVSETYDRKASRSRRHHGCRTLRPLILPSRRAVPQRHGRNPHQIPSYNGSDVSTGRRIEANQRHAAGNRHSKSYTTVCLSLILDMPGCGDDASGRARGTIHLTPPPLRCRRHPA